MEGKPPPDKGQEKKAESLLEKALEKRAAWAKELPSVAAQMKALAREVAKDINSTMHQVFFGQPATPGEPGTPLNPTPQMVTQDLDVLGGYKAMLDGYGSKSLNQGKKEMER